MVKVSLQHGTSGASASAYALLGSVLLAGLFHRYGEGYRFGKLACDLVERHGFIASQAKVYVSMGARCLLDAADRDRDRLSENGLSRRY